LNILEQIQINHSLLFREIISIDVQTTMKTRMLCVGKCRDS